MGKWTPQFFREQYGDRKVPVFERKRAVTVKDSVRLADYIEEITSSTYQNRAKYLFSLKIPREFPELLQDLEPRPAYWEPNWLESKYLLPGLPKNPKTCGRFPPPKKSSTNANAFGPKLGVV